MQKPLSDEELTQWRNQCREIDQIMESSLWKLGQMIADGIESYGKPAKEFIKSFRTPPNITTSAVSVHKATRNLNLKERITFAIARELSAIPDEQTRFKFLDEAIEASDSHMDPSSFRKDLREQIASCCQSPRAPRKQPVKLARDLISFFESQSDDFWTSEMSLAWAKELKPLVDWFERLNANRPE